MTDNDTGLYAHDLRKVHTQHVGKQKPRFFMIFLRAMHVKIYLKIRNILNAAF